MIEFHENEQEPLSAGEQLAIYGGASLVVAVMAVALVFLWVSR